VDGRLERVRCGIIFGLARAITVRSANAVGNGIAVA